MVYEKVVAAGKAEGKWIGYIECGADGHHATVTFSPATFATSEEDNIGYSSVPIFVGPCTLAASIAAYYILLNSPGDYNKTFQADWTDGSEFHFATVDESDSISLDEDTAEEMEAADNEQAI